MKLFRFFAVAVLILPLLFSCAKEKSVSREEIESELLEAYMVVTYDKVNIPRPAKTDMGYYYIPLRTTGNTTYPADAQWIRYDISYRKQDGTLVYTNVESVAKDYSSFSYYTHYTPEYRIMGDSYGYITKGVADAMRKHIAVGDSVRLIMQPSIAGLYIPNENTNNASRPVILDIAVRDAILLPYEKEEAELLAFREANFPLAKLLKGESGKDTTNIYFQEIDPTADTVVIKDGYTVKMLYTTRFLDGYLLDTNIADTAKNNNIYSYDPAKYSAEGLSVTIGKDEVVSGFEAALKNMKVGSSAVVMFNSEWGYGTSGKADKGMPPYTSLYFHIWLLSVDNNE